MKCEICKSEKKVIAFSIGGGRPMQGYRKPLINLCEVCQRSLANLLENNKLHFRREPGRDTTNSRYSIVKAAIKRERFGDPNASAAEMLRQIASHNHDKQEE